MNFIDYSKYAKCDGPSVAKYSSSELDPAQVDRYCRQNKFTGWFDTSALNDININEAVDLLVGKILANEAAAMKETTNTEDDQATTKLDHHQSNSNKSKKTSSNCC